MTRRAHYLIFVCAYLASLSGIAQEKGRENIKKWWVPDYTKIQFAGAIGFLSAGTGYINKTGKSETELMVGFLPKSIGGDHLISATLKTNRIPWKTELNENWTLLPFQFGGYLSYTFGSEFNTFLPDRYPSGYYWWSSSLRIGMFFGSRFRYRPDTDNPFKSIDFYYEVGTYDLKFLSYVQNVESLTFLDVVNLSFGIRLEF
jgi:hypothetical protein